MVDAFDYLVEAEQWGCLSQSMAAERAKELAELTPPDELAEWVAALPPRAETAEMFHRGVEPLIQKDPAFKPTAEFWRQSRARSNGLPDG